MKYFLLVLVLSTTAARAEEWQVIHFNCNSQYSVTDVIYNEDLLYGISPLPSGCRWLAPNTVGLIGKTMSIVPVGTRYSRISEVRIDDVLSYSAGIIDPMS